MDNKGKSKMISGSLCITDILTAAKAKHSAFKKGKDNGKLYMNVVVWQNEEADDNGNEFSITLSSTKEKRESGEEKKTIYVGNLRYVKPKGPGEMTDVNDKDVEDVLQIADDLPF